MTWCKGVTRQRCISRSVRAVGLSIVALLWVVPLMVHADTPPPRLPAPPPGVVYSDFAGGFAAIQVGQKYGFINKSGAFAIPAQFDDVFAFDNGLAPVKVGEMWGYIDAKGKQVIAPQFEEARQFSDVGLARAMSGGKWGFIDRSGTFVIPAKYDDAAGFFVESPVSLPEVATTPPVLAPVKVGDMWGYIDTTGKQVIAPQFSFADDFTTAGIAPVGVGDKHGFIDTTGKFVIPAQYDDVLLDVENGLAGVKVGDQWGYVDIKTGKMVIAPRFAVAEPFINGIAAVQTGNLWGFIGTDGTFIMPPQFTDADAFGPAGLTIAKTGGAYGRQTRLGDNPMPTQSGGKYGFIDRGGRFVIAPQFEDAFIFQDGLARVQVNGKVGFIDQTGAFVIPPQFIPDPNVSA